MAALEIEVLPAREKKADAELDAFFEASPTSVAQLTTGWRNVIADLGGDEPVYLGCRQGGRLVGVLPAYLFRGPLGNILTSVPQAGPLGGIASLPHADQNAVYRSLLGAFVEEAKRRDCALASVITNPFWPDRALYDRYFSSDYALENTCQVLDLRSYLTVEGNPARGSDNVRRNLKIALAGDIYIDAEQSLANIDEWLPIHRSHHRAIGALPIPRGIFTAALEHMVPRDKARFFFVRLTGSGRMIAGGMYLFHGSVMDAFMTAMVKKFAHFAPGYLLAIHSMRFAQQRGLSYYNWQASPPDGGVRRFKRQWGSRDANYAYLTQVTGDIDQILRSDIETVRSAYRWHYVLPYDRIGNPREATCAASSRAAAWRAGTGAPHPRGRA